MKEWGLFMRVDSVFSHRGGVLIAILLTVSLCLPQAILATDSEESAETLQRQTEAAAETFGGKLFILPIPIANPTIGTGLGAVSMYLFPAGENAPPSSIYLGGFWADSESWGGGLGTQTYFTEDKYRLAGFLGYFDVNVDFYGIGNRAGDTPVAAPINQSGPTFVPSFLFRLTDNVYLGPRYRLMNIETTVDKQGLPTGHPGLLLPDRSSIRSAGLGIVLDWDTKDNKFNPSSGFFLDVNTNFANEAFGSDEDYHQFEIGYSLYTEVGEGQVLAWKATGCFNGGDLPFYELCMLGSIFASFRGYVAGQYRDEISLTTQIEYRRRLYKKMGMVAFGGIGQVAPELGELDSDNILGSLGVGIRFMPFEETGVNLGLDYARGRDSEAWYFRIGEAF
jgi:hypothetical protein